ncbi:MAG: hypothetical protein P1V20_29060 [Verrucomicrobiales bacterium]|nr:hypothetical protein [Verrucomicrobiales bacterium]
MSLSEVLPLAIELPEKERVELMQELARSMAMEVIDVEIDQRRREMESNPEIFSLDPDDLKNELTNLRNAR